MAEYQLRPTLTKKQWLAIVAAVLVAFLTPVILNQVVAETERMDSTVEIDLLGTSTMELKDENGDAIVCQRTDLNGVMDTYVCGNTTIFTGAISSSEDQDQTIRRMVRAATYNNQALHATVADLGAGIRLADFTKYNALGLSLATEQDGTTMTAYVVVESRDANELVRYGNYAITAFVADHRAQDAPPPPLLPDELRDQLRSQDTDSGADSYEAQELQTTALVQTLSRNQQLVAALQGANHE